MPPRTANPASSRNLKSRKPTKNDSKTLDELSNKLEGLNIQQSSKLPASEPPISTSVAATLGKSNKPSVASSSMAKRRPKPAAKSTLATTAEDNHARDVPPIRSPAEMTKDTMDTYNNASRIFTSIAQTGWKVSTAQASSSSKDPGHSLSNVTEAARKCMRALKPVRALNIPNRAVDIEKAAVVFAGKLIAMELYEVALEALVDSRHALLKLYSPSNTSLALASQDPPLAKQAPNRTNSSQPRSTQSAFSTAQYGTLTCLPLPSESEVPSTEVLVILCTYQTHAISTLAKLCDRRSDPSLDLAISYEGNFLHWERWYTTQLENTRIQQVVNTIARSLSGCDCEPTTLLRVRLYGLKCLAIGRLEPDETWQQVTKCARSFYKAASALSSSKDSDATIAKEVQTFFASFVSVIETHQDSDKLLCGPEFNSALTFWLRFARWQQDLDQMEWINRLLGGKSDTHLEKLNPTGEVTIPNAAQLQVILSRAVVYMAQVRSEEHVQDEDARCIDEALKVVRHVFAFIQKDITTDMAAKLCRSLDKVFTLCEKLTSDVKESVSSQLAHLLEKLFKSIVAEAEHLLKKRSWFDVYQQSSLEIIGDLAIDGLMTLSASLTRNRTDPATTTTALQYLRSASSILNLTKDQISVLSPSQQLNYAIILRTLSASFHNGGARLLNEGRESISAPFWEDAVELGEKALSIWDICKDADKLEVPEKRKIVGVNETEMWIAVREKYNVRRLELLAYAYGKAGERRLAHQSFIRAVLARPGHIFETLAKDSGEKRVRDLFAPSDTFTQMIERITSLATFDLLLKGEDATLRKVMDDHGVPKAAIGAILEYQLSVLESYQHREETGDVMKQLIKDLKDMYGSGEYPLRRARTLMRSIELAYSMDDSAQAPSPVVVQGLLQSQNLAGDVLIASFVPQYMASLEILLMLHAHRHGDVNSTSLVLQHANKALRSLQDILGLSKPAGKPSASSDTSARTAPIKRSTRKTPAAASKNPKKALPPKTPKKKTHAASMDALAVSMDTLELEPELKSSLIIDDVDKFARKLESTSHLLGLLGHLFPRMELLDIIIQFAERDAFPMSTDALVKASVELAHEYIKLGKTERAATVFGRALAFGRNPAHKLSDEIRIMFLLRYAESLAIVSNTEKSLTVYNEALLLSETLVMPDKSASTLVRANTRIAILERSALACGVYAAIQFSRDDTTASIGGLMQAVRLWNRAIDTLVKLEKMCNTSSSDQRPKSPNPFQVAPAVASTSATPGIVTTRDSLMDGVQWRLSEGLSSTLFALGKLYFLRGSIKSSEFFLQKAQDLSRSLNAPILFSRALGRAAETETHLGRLESGGSLLSQAVESWQAIQSVAAPDLVDLHRVQGHHRVASGDEEDAKRIYRLAREILSNLDGLLDRKKVETVASLSSRRSSVGIASVSGQDVIIPTILASVLRQHIWLLRAEDEEELEAEYNDLLAQLLALPASLETKIEENSLMGKLRLEEVLARFDADLYLSSITESVIALPMCMSSGGGATSLTSTRDILQSLGAAEDFFWSCLELSFSRGSVYQVRDAALSLLLIRAYQTSLGKSKKNDTTVSTALLDISAATTLRRELLEAIDGKIRNPLAVDDLVWPSMAANGAPVPAAIPTSKRRILHDSEDEDEDAEGTMDDYWRIVRDRYKSETMDAASLASPLTEDLPDNWSVVNISVTDDKSTLFISRQRPRKEPLVFCLPLDRQGRRDGDEEHLSYEAALEEFSDIISLSDLSSKNAYLATDKESRANWWADRAQLDTRLKDLLENIEFCWLGAFKTILSPPSGYPPEIINALRLKIDKVFAANGMISQERKTQFGLKLDDAIIDCFSTLSPQCRDEEFEDLVYFVLDLYQLHGIPVALSEVDIDRVVVDLRSAFEEHHARGRGKVHPPKDHHLFLVLDKNVQGLPWESIPALRGRSISRVPSVSFLIDRLELVKIQKRDASRQDHQLDRIAVNPLKTFYVLNPSGDLVGTQQTYQAPFCQMEKLGWEGIVGRPPTEEELVKALTQSDIFLYFGHGGAQNYIRSHRLRQLPKCAVTMLWGCSSGAMREMGDFDRVGIPNHYMVAGCPTLVANLWDVTDREIDRVAQSVLAKLHLDHDSLNPQKRSSGSETPISVVQAVAESRSACKLKYLTGAAPVVYGIPFYH